MLSTSQGHGSPNCPKHVREVKVHPINNELSSPNFFQVRRLPRTRFAKPKFAQLRTGSSPEYGVFVEPRRSYVRGPKRFAQHALGIFARSGEPGLSHETKPRLTRSSPSHYHSKLQPEIRDQSSGVHVPPPAARTLCNVHPKSTMQLGREIFIAGWDAMQKQCLSSLVEAFNLRKYNTVVDLGGERLLLAV